MFLIFKWPILYVTEVGTCAYIFRYIAAWKYQNIILLCFLLFCSYCHILLRISRGHYRSYIPSFPFKNDILTQHCLLLYILSTLLDDSYMYVDITLFIFCREEKKNKFLYSAAIRPSCRHYYIQWRTFKNRVVIISLNCYVNLKD